MSRVALDFYETPPWQTKALRKRIGISGRVIEPCVGDGSLARVFSDCHVFTNDIDTQRIADCYQDATKAEAWRHFPTADWAVTNPPFNSALPILQHAREHALIGVVMLLRLSFLEPTELRSTWLATNPPDKQIVLPRWSYKQNGSTDSVTTGWYVWLRNNAVRFELPIEIVPLEEKVR